MNAHRFAPLTQQRSSDCFELAAIFSYLSRQELPVKKSSKRYVKWVCAATFCFVVALALSTDLFPSHALSGTTYVFAELPSLGGEARAFAINACGQVAGESAASPSPTPVGGPPRVPVRWNNGQVSSLGTLGGATGAANAINSSGMIVGTAHTSSNVGHAFLWRNGSMQDLTPTASVSQAYGINDSGVAVGTIVDDSSDTLGNVAFSWSSGTLQIIPAGNGMTPQYAQAISNAGTIVGAGLVGSASRPFQQKNGVLTNLGTLGSSPNFALGVSEDDSTVGYSFLNSSAFHAFIWKSGMSDLGTLTGGSSSVAYDINNGGVIVGYSEVSGGAAHAFVYENAVMRDLNLPATTSGIPSGWVLQEARGINDSGQIVGFAIDTNNKQHAFILTPTGVTPPACATPTPAVSVTVSPANGVAEDDPNQNLVYTFTRSGAPNLDPLPVKISVGGTATADDFLIPSLNGTVTIPANSNTVTVTVDPIADTTVEPNETVTLTITPDAAYTIGTGSASGTILNDDTSVSVAVSPASVTESGLLNLQYTFTRSGVTSGSLTVNFSVGGSATFSSDYSQSGAATFNSTSGTVTIPAGNPSATVVIDPAPDATGLEPNEDVTLTVTSGTGYSVASPTSATGTITDTPTIYTTDGVNAVAIDSANFTTGPFRQVDNLNFSTDPDHLTRVILFTSNLGFAQNQPNPPPTLTVNVSGYPAPLPIENVGPITGVPGLSGSYIIVQLPKDLWTLLVQNQPKTDLQVTVTLNNTTSNTATISIAP